MLQELKETILHIDDDESNRYSVKRIMERAGYNVIHATNGEDGLSLIVKELPDLIILDINLPDLNGYEVCKLVKANPAISSIPLLQTSASYTTTQNKVAGLDSGADGYLTQPLEPAILVATAKSLLRTKQAEKKATKATQARDEMLAIVSHDLRTPLSFIMLQSRIMEKQMDEGKFILETAGDKLRKINDSCHRMNRLIMDLMDVTQIDEGKFLVKFNPVNVQSLVDSLSAFEDLAATSQIELKFNLPEKDIVFDGDRDRLIQMIGNLVSNSLKFTDAGGKITMSFSSTSSEVILEISDTGKGIASKDLKNIFNRYWQGRYERRDGIGLGLSIVKGIVDAHAGTISLESEVGIGTKFHISIPLAHTIQQ